MSLIPQFKTELQYIPTVKACLKLSQVDCFCLRLKGSLASQGWEKWTPRDRSKCPWPRLGGVGEAGRQG